MSEGPSGTEATPAAWPAHDHRSPPARARPPRHPEHDWTVAVWRTVDELLGLLGVLALAAVIAVGSLAGLVFAHAYASPTGVERLRLLPPTLAGWLLAPAVPGHYLGWIPGAGISLLTGMASALVLWSVILHLARRAVVDPEPGRSRRRLAMTLLVIWGSAGVIAEVWAAHWDRKLAAFPDPAYVALGEGWLREDLRLDHSFGRPSFYLRYRDEGGRPWSAEEVEARLVEEDMSPGQRVTELDTSAARFAREHGADPSPSPTDEIWHWEGGSAWIRHVHLIWSPEHGTLEVIDLQWPNF